MKLLVLMDRYKQVTAVANALQMKQPTISFHMKKMETEWGVKLFEAKGGRIVLTYAGQMLLPYATQISGLYDEAEAALHAYRDNKRSVIRVGCTDCAMTALVRSNWLDSIYGQPDFHISIQTGNEQSLLGQLESNVLDLVFCGHPSRDSRSFQTAMLLSSPLRLIVPADHPLQQAIPSAPYNNLSDHSFIEYAEQSVSEIVTAWKAQLQWKLRSGARMDAIEMILHSVQAGLGLAVLPACVLPGPGTGVAGLELPGAAAEWSLHALWKSDYGNAALLRRLIEIVEVQGN